MSLGTRVKDPDETLSYSIDWTSELGADSISTSTPPTYSVSTGLTHSTDSYTTAVTTVKIADGTAGRRYVNTVRIVKATSGEILERSFRIKVTGR